MLAFVRRFFHAVSVWRASRILVTGAFARRGASALFVVVGFAWFQGIAIAQGTLINGDNATGAILTAGATDSWTFDAVAGEAMSISIGEQTDANGHFSPWIRLFAPN